MSPPLQAHDYIGLAPAAAAAPASSSASSSSSSASPAAAREVGAHLTLRLGLPGSESPERPAPPGSGVALCLGPLPKGFASGAKRGFADSTHRGAAAGAGGGRKEEKGKGGDGGDGARRAAKAQVVGWPPVRSYRKNTLAASVSKTKGEDEGRSEAGCLYVKVSMDGVGYLRKVHLKTYSGYEDLSLALEKMFSCFITGQTFSRKPPGGERLTDSPKIDALQDQEYVLTYEDKDGDWMLVGDLPWDLFTTICRKLKIMRGADAAGMAPRPLEQSGQSK